MSDRAGLLARFSAAIRSIERVGAAIVPGFVRRRYALKFFVSFLFVVAVIAGIGLFVFVQAGGIVEDDTRTQLNETSALQANSISEWVSGISTQARATSDSEELRSRTPGNYLRRVQPLLSEDILSLHFVDTARGTVSASTVRPLEGSQLSNRDVPWASADIAQGPGEDSAVWRSSRSYLSSVHDDEPVMAFASSVPGQDGYLVVVSRIQPQLERIESERTDETTRILNAVGETVLNVDETVDETIHGEPVRETRTSLSQTVEAGDTELHAYAPVRGTEWVAITSVAKSEAFAARDAVGQNITLLVGFALLSLTVVGFVLGRQTISPISRLRTRAERMDEGDLSVDLSTERVDEIGRLFESFDGMRQSLRERIQEAEDALSDAEEARASAEDAREEAQQSKERAERMNSHLEQKAADYRNVMQACAAGDFTQRMNPESESEPMAKIAEEFNEMITQIEETVAEVTAFANEVATASTDVATGANEIEDASSQVSRNVQEISSGAIEQSESLSEISGEMSNLSASIEQAASSTSRVAETSSAAVDRGEDGQQAAQQAIDEMGHIERRTETTADQIVRLEAQMDEIVDIVEVISDIADQTNMLALNANIEAARAGDAGSGFAVVANQVKQLAEETQESAAEIEQIITEAQQQTTATVDEIEETSEAVTRGVDIVEESLTALEEIVDKIEDTNRGVQEIDEATDNQAKSTQRVVASVDEIEEISDDVSAQAQQVAATAEEQTAAISSIADSIDSLKEQSETLVASLNRFTVRADDIEPADSTPPIESDGSGTSDA